MVTDTNPRSGRPKSEAKREAILEAASRLFLDQGLQGTSMDAVAEAAGVSKQTVYSHFESKDDLYRAVIRCKVGAYGFGAAEIPIKDSLEATLVAVGHQFLNLLFDDQVIAMHRVVIGETAAHPKTARLFYETGPAATLGAVARLLRHEMDQGRLRRDDPEYAAALLLNMYRGHYQLQHLLGIDPKLTEQHLDAHITKAVAQFLALYGH